MKKALLLTFLALLLILTSSFFYFLNNPYTKIRKAESEVATFYLSCYDLLMRQNHFDSLLRRLTTENMDLKSMGVAVNYAVDHKLCEFIPEIERKCTYFKAFPADTTWKVQITKTYARVWNMKEAVFGYSMCFRLEELKRKCIENN